MPTPPTSGPGPGPRPDAGPGTGAGAAHPPRAELGETHTAVLFFLADRVYKLKKPVGLGFVDFTTLAARRRGCEREIELNRRFAPDVYLGLAEVHCPFDSPSGREGDGGPEPVVVMRRMPAGRRLSALVRRGEDVQEPLRAVARLLAARHADSPRGPEVVREGTRDALAGRWEANFTEVRAMEGSVGLPEGVSEAERLVRRYLGGREVLFETRIRRNRVVDGHGDLRAEDIFCLDDGPRVLDCLEFDDRLRYVDGLDDAAFLAMDLERLGAPDAAAFFLARYSEYSADPAPPSLWHHYVAYRAFVRAKVSLIQAVQGAPGAQEEARGLVTTALLHLRASAVRLILVGGLPGRGKSTLSGALADRMGVTLLSSDRVRKELAGIPAEQPAPAPYGEGLYTPERTRATYSALLDRADALLSSGESVVLDASWTDPEQREAARRTAGRAGAELVALNCRTPGDVADSRLAGRAPGVSDAGAEVAAAMARREAPWPDAVTVDTSGPLRAAADQALAAVYPYGAGPAPAFRRPYMEPG
ncbi:AAA family ATPase [Streptomyces barkulensis]|uniref:bifunctional aminoglycoside phosphotransferase/ATP-binding protein n=1 Tax=Streptomyces barkulensis TaxID=1257026 RepID=UPI000C6D1FC0|nr:bifunctional aminoglycoside phosphotransferase/ATP-binding protein [Streptomyces barkulensis]